MTAEQEQERVPRMSLAETRQYAIKQHAIDEHKYASEVMCMCDLTRHLIVIAPWGTWKTR